MGKVFIVDDDDELRDLLVASFRKAGHEVIECTDGREAAEALTKITPPPDLLLIDLIIPGMDGFELIRYARKVLADVPIVVTSSYIEKETEEIILDVGADAFIRKPIYYQDLVKFIRKPAS